MSHTDYSIYYGGWYQRTTLHLSEVHGFLASGSSYLPLSTTTLKLLHNALDIAHVIRRTGYFEYVEALTTTGMSIRYYEDGLYTVSADGNDPIHVQSTLASYFHEHLEPAIAFLFSLGAPTPKALADLQSHHPTVITKLMATGRTIKPLDSFGQIYQEVASPSVHVFKTQDFIIINATSTHREKLRELVEMQIFFREFKDQLEKYLHIHRTLWEEISAIKEQKQIKGADVEHYRAQLDNYKKTIDLIANRINQMGSYVTTRASIAHRSGIANDLDTLFQYRFEVLTDTLSYIREIWQMTSKYLDSAIQNLVEIKSQSTSRNLTSLQVITTAGVVAGFVTHLSRAEFPTFTLEGGLFFAGLLGVTWAVNYAIFKAFQLKTYSLSFVDKFAAPQKQH